MDSNATGKLTNSPSFSFEANKRKHVVLKLVTNDLSKKGSQVLYFSYNKVSYICFKNLKLEKGNVATAWTPAIEDVNGMIEDAQKAADDAAEAAKKAQTDATNANKELTNIKSDNLISPIEKTALKQQQADIRSEYGEITANAARYSVSTTAYKAAYDKASAALTKYTASSPEYITVGSDYANISAYYAARKTILDAIAAAAKKAADDALNKANQAVEDAARAGHYLLDFDNDSGQVVCDADGNVTGGYPTTNAMVWYGTNPDTGWSFKGAFSGCTGSVNASSGAVAVTGVSKDDASVTITATKSGKPELSAVFTIVKVRSGRDGEDGTNGVGIKSITNKYAVSASNTTAPTSWSDTVPTMTTTNRYLWNYEIVTYTNGTTNETKKRVIGVYGDKGNTGATGSPGKDGADGVGIKSITKYYLASSASSGVTTSTSGWTTSVQATSSSKKYLWNYEVVTYTNDTKYTSSPVIIGTHGDSGAVAKQITGVTDLNKMLGAEYEGRWYAVGSNGIANKPSGVDAFGLDVYRTASGYYTQLLTPGNTGTNKLWIRTANNGAWSAWVEKGKDGANGAPGAPGANGKTSYLHIAYANDTTGGGFSVSDSTNKLYIGQYTDFTVEDSTDYKKYSWTRIKGDKGDTGPTGSQGIPGTSSYFHVKYSSNPDGNPMTDTPNTYIGTAVTTSPTPPSSYTSYKWTQFKGSQGAKGEQGIPGTNGADGKTSYLHIKYSNDGGKTFTANNGETPGSYLGQYVDFTEADSGSVSAYAWSKIKGETGPQGVPGTPGKDGTPRYTWIRYADNASGSGISNSPTGKTYIGFAYNKTTATESNTPSDYTWSLIKGEKGDQGVPGAKGADGKTTYTWIKYSDNANGSGMYDTPKSTTQYIGIAVNKTTATESNTTSDYTWSKFKGDDGADGKGIKSTAVTYQASTSGNTPPTGTWSATVPSVAANQYLWTRTVITYTDNTSSTSYSVGKMGATGAAGPQGKPGADGDGIVSVSNTYQIGSSGTTAPTGSWSATVPSPQKGKYLWTKTVTTYKKSDPTTVYSVSYYGTDGAAAKYVRVSGEQVFVYANNFSGNPTPTSITLTATLTGTSGYQWSYKQAGQTSFTNISGATSQTYALAHNNSTVWGSAKSVTIRCTSGGVYDEMTIAKVSSGTNGTNGKDGADGKNGADAYTVILGNESHAFQGTTSAAIAASTKCEVIAYKGATRVAATIGTITGAPSGMSTSISSNGTTSASFTVSVTSSLTTGQGVLTVPITVDGKSFTKNFSFSVAFKGNTGATGSPGKDGADGVGIKSITEYYLASSASSGVTTSTSGWTTSVQATSSSKKYLWNYEVVTYTNDTKYTSSPVIIGTHGDSGAVAKQITGVTDLNKMLGAEYEGRWYAVGSNGIANKPSGVDAFGLDVYRTASGYYTQLLTPGNTGTNKLWIRTANNGAWSAWVEKGKDGANGAPGAPGANGKTSYLHIAYANDTTGGGFSVSDSTNKLYIGQYTDFTVEDSTDYKKYSWTRIKGDKGDTGPTGSQGIPGTSSYFHVKYSSNPDGNPMTDTPNTYIGTAVTTSPTPPSSYTSYKWTQFKGSQGAKGEQGIPGTNGADGKTSYLHIKYSNDGGKTFTANNGETPGSYLGQYVDFTEADSGSVSAYAWSKIKGETGPQGVPGTPGKDGTPRYTWIRYADNASGSGISNSPTGKTYIGFAYNKTTATESNTPSDYTWSLIKGEKGDQGVPGAKGADGKTTYTWIKYSDNANGSGMYDTPKSTTQYIGIAVNKTTATESNTTSDYTWSKFKGDDGADGKGIKSTAVTYQASTSGNTPPTGTWSATVPSVAANQYLWTRTVITYTDNTSSTSYSVGKMGATGAAGPQGKPGADGDGIVSVSNTYQIGSSGTTAPTGSWSATVPSPQKGKYLWTKTVTTYKKSDPTTVYSVSYYGTDGAAAKYVRVSGEQVFVYANNFSGNPTPTSITLTATLTGTSGYQWSYKQAGQTSFTNISGATSQTYALAHNNSTVWGSAKSVTIRCTSGGVYDEMTIAKVSSGTNGTNGKDGADGKNGADAYTVILGNESHAFQGTTSAAIAASTKCEVIAYKGATRVAATIGTITGAPSGMSTSISSNGTTSASFTVSVTSSLTTGQGVLTVPITVDGKSFTKNFSFSVAFKGNTGATGATGPKGDDAVFYIIETDVRIVKKSWDNKLTPTSVTCTKYKQTGSNARATTTEKTLKYQRVGTDSSVQTAASGSSVTVSPTSTTTSIKFWLYDGSTIIDRDEIPVVGDAVDVYEKAHAEIKKKEDSILSTVQKTYSTKDELTGLETTLGKKVSTVEQTAESLKTTVSGLNGKVSMLEQTDSSLKSQISTANGKISTLEQTTSKISLKVSSIWPDNLFPDGSFEYGGLSNQNLSNCTVSIDGSSHIHGSKSLKIQCKTGNSWVYLGRAQVPVVAGKLYTIVMWIRATSSFTESGGATGAYFSTNNQLELAGFTAFQPAFTSAWTRKTYKVTAPSGSKFLVLRLGTAGQTTNRTLYFDGIMVFEGDLTGDPPTSFIEGKRDGELATGIDVVNKKITVTGDQFVIRNNAGDVTASVDADGVLKIGSGEFSGYMKTVPQIDPNNNSVTVTRDVLKKGGFFCFPTRDGSSRGTVTLPTSGDYLGTHLYIYSGSSVQTSGAKISYNGVENYTSLVVSTSCTYVELVAVPNSVDAARWHAYQTGQSSTLPDIVWLLLVPGGAKYTSSNNVLTISRA